MATFRSDTHAGFSRLFQELFFSEERPSKYPNFYKEATLSNFDHSSQSRVLKFGLAEFSAETNFGILFRSHF